MVRKKKLLTNTRGEQGIQKESINEIWSRILTTLRIQKP